MSPPGLARAAAGTHLANFVDQLTQTAAAVWRDRPHGELASWLAVLDALPVIQPDRVDLRAEAITLAAEGIAPATQERLRELLAQLHPWRKGPFELYGVRVDAEWRSHLKWARLAPHIAPLAGRLVLDVGCGNGYYCWRMLGEGARLVLGIDPTQLYLMQYQAIRQLLGARTLPLYLLPLGVERLPAAMAAFDTIFSMGVFYHRRSPFDHLLELLQCLRPGGQLVLETLVIAGDAGQVLVPQGRYAQMRNVWFIPTPATLLGWLRRAGFREPRLVDLSATTSAEQASSDWMRFESLSDFLDPADPHRTVEGHPAPLRAILLAER